MYSRSSLISRELLMTEQDVLRPLQDEPQARPTSVRYYVLSTAFVASVLLYLHRYTMTYAGQYVREDLGLTNAQLGHCQSAFFFAYALGQVPSGWLSSKYGSRIMLTIYILIWSAFTASMGVVSGFASLILVRAAAGLGQAGAYPTCAAVVGKWAPFRVRGFVSSLIALGGRVGSAVAPKVTSLLIVALVPCLLIESSTFKSNDLLDAAYLAEQLDLSTTTLEKPTEIVLAQQSLAKKLQAGLSPAVQKLLPGIREAYAKAQATAPAKPRQFGDKPQPIPLASSGEMQSLADGLNTLLAGPVLMTETEAKILPVEQEGKRLWKLNELSNPQRTRLNRLLMEAGFPTAVRKVYGGSWRQVMFILGSLGIVAAFAWMVIVRNVPQEHPWVNRQECELIAAGQPVSTATGTGSKVPWRRLLSNMSLWNQSITQMGTNIGWAFLVTWLPRYLQEVHLVPFEERSMLASVPLWVGWFGMLSGGWATDRLTKAMGLRIGRSWPIGLSRFVGAAAFLALLVHPNAWTATALFAIVAFSTDFGASSMWAYSQDVGGQNTAAVLGWANMWGNFGAALSPVLVVYLLGATEDNWDLAFGACAVAFIIAGIAGMFIDATDKIEPEVAG